MLTKYKDITSVDSEKGVSKPFKNVSCQKRIRNFFQGEGTKLRHFFKRSFFGRINLKQIEEEEKP